MLRRGGSFERGVEKLRSVNCAKNVTRLIRVQCIASDLMRLLVSILNHGILECKWQSQLKQVNKVMSNDKDTKNNALKAGVGSAIGGVFASIGSVALNGSVTGLSATGITSGLAVVGTLAGGGMAVGVFIVAASPIAAGVLGYQGYKFYKNRKSS